MLKRHSFFAFSGRQAPVALAAWVAMASAAHAADVTALVASGQASLTGIRYELIDLRPDDAETPWIRFGSANEPISGLIDATGVSHDPDAARQLSWQGLLPTNALSVTSADGYTTAQASSDSLSTSFTVDAAALDKLAPADDGRNRLEVFSQVRTGQGIASLAYEVDEATGAVNAVDGDTSWQPLDFTLSAHTAIVVHAQASASLTLNPQQGGWDIRNPGGAFSDEPAIGSGVQIALMMLRPDFAMQQSYASLDDFYADMDKAYQLNFDGLSADWTPDDLATMTPASRELLLQLDNDSASETHGSFLMTGMSQFAVTQAAVPEPATWALMGLGLIGLATARKRSQALA